MVLVDEQEDDVMLCSTFSLVSVYRVLWLFLHRI